uniref:C-type lectin domain-containing protein n=1 Tax=Amphiprion percula TaxID=161767 RepID=A0A3P8SVV6_AMPPE
CSSSLYLPKFFCLYLYLNWLMFEHCFSSISSFFSHNRTPFIPILLADEWFNKETWSEAQAYCRQHHTDLSFFNSQSEIEKLPRAADGNLVPGWIGLYRDPNNKTAWKWSGGGQATFQNWDIGEPNNYWGDENNAEILLNGKWDDARGSNSYSFYCVDVTVVEEKMSWEDALSHCRDKQTDLPSLLSETDRLLDHNDIKHKNISEQVWMGLRFLGDRWMWVNGDPLEYEGDIRKHVFIQNEETWSEAQAYCRQHYTDLSFFNSQSEIEKLPRAADGNLVPGWIGLYRDPNNKTAWKWSGGGDVTFQNWADRQPNNYGGNQNNAAIFSNGKWHDARGSNSYSFYCVDVTVVEEKMSWEDALSHCRDKQTDLPSLLSETDRLLDHNDIKHKNISERVWMGLRFLGDRWMWVNGDPLEYEAWSQEGGQDHQCPVRKCCGALTKEGLWENWDCQDKLNFICV